MHGYKRIIRIKLLTHAWSNMQRTDVDTRARVYLDTRRLFRNRASVADGSARVAVQSDRRPCRTCDSTALCGIQSAVRASICTPCRRSDFTSSASSVNGRSCRIILLCDHQESYRTRSRQVLYSARMRPVVTADISKSLTDLLHQTVPNVHPSPAWISKQIRVRPLACLPLPLSAKSTLGHFPRRHGGSPRVSFTYSAECTTTFE